jgi:hypothetical protein
MLTTAAARRQIVAMPTVCRPAVNTDLNTHRRAEILAADEIIAPSPLTNL